MPRLTWNYSGHYATGPRDGMHSSQRNTGRGPPHAISNQVILVLFRVWLKSRRRSPALCWVCRVRDMPHHKGSTQNTPCIWGVCVPTTQTEGKAWDLTAMAKTITVNGHGNVCVIVAYTLTPVEKWKSHVTANLERQSFNIPFSQLYCMARR